MVGGLSEYLSITLSKKYQTFTENTGKQTIPSNQAGDSDWVKVSCTIEHVLGDNDCAIIKPGTIDEVEVDTDLPACKVSLTGWTYYY